MATYAVTVNRLGSIYLLGQINFNSLKNMKLTNQDTGFSYGPACVTRLCSDEKLGVWLMVAGGEEQVQIRVTKGGRLRIGKPEKADPHFAPQHA